jgi:hypothetical protein
MNTVSNQQLPTVKPLVGTFIYTKGYTTGMSNKQQKDDDWAKQAEEQTKKDKAKLKRQFGDFAIFEEDNKA